MQTTIPLKNRKIDIFILGYFFFNILFVSYVISLEQLVVLNPENFSYPIWPLPFFIDLVHWYGHNWDPLLMARPVWWKATIWIDALFFGPYYIAAIYAFIKGKNWIRVPSFIYASVMMTNVTIILSEEFYGPYAAGDTIWQVVGANASWLIFPIIILYRMTKSQHPFTIEAKASKVTG